jgi:type II secretory ATPase GspE/PulE/Tfp pilus assembly ATPase PilB-like protein
MIDDATKKDILAGKSNFDIKANLKKMGWNDLKDDGILKVKEGMTTYEEIYRVAW